MLQTVGMLLTALMGIMTCGCDRHGGHGHDEGHDHHEHGGHHADRHEEHVEPKGPNGGRLLTDGEFEIELMIRETGGVTYFRAFARQAEQPVNPSSVQLQVALHRLGGRAEQHVFRAREDFLESEQVVYEPHSFQATITAEHSGQRHRWEIESSEARTVIAPEAARRAGIRVETLGAARIRSEVKLPGEVRFNDERRASVPARFEGRITEVRHRIGDRVRSGEILAVMESRTLADARADYIDSVHRLELAQAVFVREEALHRKKIGIEQDYLKARHEMEEMEIRKQTARQKLMSLGISAAELEQLAKEPEGQVVPFRVRQPFAPGELSRFAVVSPLDGTVVGRSVAVGQTVEGVDELFQVADLSVLWVELAMFSGQAKGIAVGQKVMIQAADLQQEGEIALVHPFVNEPARAVHLRVLLPNPQGAWRPGQFVDGIVALGEFEVTAAVRPQALQTFQDWQVIFINDGDVYEAALVEIGRRDDRWVEISTGLKPGTRYVTDGSYVVKADILKSGAAHDHDH